MKVKKLIIPLLGVIDLFAFTLLSVMLFSLYKVDNKPIASENFKTAESFTDILGVAANNIEKSLIICCDNNCITISKEAYSSFTENGEINEILLHKYFESEISPFFQNNSGERMTVSNSSGSFETWRDDLRPDISTLEIGILEAMNNNQSILTIEKKDLPGTDGNFASKYIEIDNSKQKLFVWINEKLEKEILLSGPVYGFQVYGVFPIIDKGIEPIAPGGKRMPYWMAFYHSAKQDSWYGLHALIWWYDESGKRIYESLSNIGSRQSAGCIRMLLADAKYLYENFEKDDLILIHE